MSLESFIQDLSAQKIRLEYRIVESKLNKGQVLFLNLLMVFCYICTIVWAAYGLSQKKGLLFFILPFIFLFLSNYLINKWASKFHFKGVLHFDSENLTIYNNNEIIIPYNQIKKIYFKVQLQGIGTTKYKSNPHSYTLQIITLERSYILTVERKMFLSEDERQRYNYMNPDIIWTLIQLQKDYRFLAEEKERKFKFE